MSYKRADEILPQELLKILQKYAGGELIYVPKCGETRRKWGTNTGTRENLYHRNKQILAEYENGATTKELAERYFLTEKSIQRIIRNMRQKPPVEKETSYMEENKIE